MSKLKTPNFKKAHRIEELKNELFGLEHNVDKIESVRETDELDTNLEYSDEPDEEEEINLSYVLSELESAQKDFEEKLDFIEEKLKFVMRDSGNNSAKTPRMEVHSNELLNIISNIANRYKLYSQRLVNIRSRLIF